MNMCCRILMLFTTHGSGNRLHRCSVSYKSEEKVNNLLHAYLFHLILQHQPSTYTLPTLQLQHPPTYLN